MPHRSDRGDDAYLRTAALRLIVTHESDLSGAPVARNRQLVVRLSSVGAIAEALGDLDGADAISRGDEAVLRTIEARWRWERARDFLVTLGCTHNLIAKKELSGSGECAGDGICDVATGVSYDSPLTPLGLSPNQVTGCTPGQPIMVPAGENLRLKLYARRDTSVRSDKDTMRLICEP